MKHTHRLLALALLALTFAALSNAAQAQFSVLYNFNSSDPTEPTYSGIIAQGRDGNLYTTADTDVFSLTPLGTLTVLSNTGVSTIGGLTLGTDGDFYGTTQFGGTGGAGTIFKMTPSGSMKVLYTFTGGMDGCDPTAPPIQASDGNFYGTTLIGGNGSCFAGLGTIYKVTPTGSFKTLYRFDVTHGFWPWGPLVQGLDGNLYGTTFAGGAGSDGAGVVFKITPAGALTVLHNFVGSDGMTPIGPLVLANDGNFYGTTEQGNPASVVFKITPTGVFHVLHTFNPLTDGAYAIGGLVQATDGNFYGTAVLAGPFGNGTIFKITSTGNFSVLYSFDGTTGSEPEVTLVQNTNGILYGDTHLGGTQCLLTGCGVFYSLNLGLAPFTTFLPPSGGKVGTKIEFLGQGFTGTTGVSFNGTSASFKVVSDTYLTATVPVGAKTGPVTITTPGGTLTSNKRFRVIP